MTKFTAFVIIIALRIGYHSPASNEYGRPALAPFSSPSTFSAQPSKIIEFKGSLVNNKVYLQWEVDENQTADQFEIERSRDGKNFFMAALVFCTEQPRNESYKFYEKNNYTNVSYRIKLINKDHRVEYSNIVVIRS
jgi:hypothetical protein